jgi:hypothetical protein
VLCSQFRTILERIRPVDAKLKHQINRLVKAATSDGEAGGDDDVHKPRPQALVAHDGKLNKKGTNVDASEGDDDEGSADEEHGDVYKPLKRSAVMFEEGGATAKAAREEERRKARAAKSKLFKDLLGMYSEAPEEIAAAGDTEAVDESLKQRDEDRRRFEEDHFVRLTVPRGEKTLKKKRERERLRVDPLKDLTTGFAEIERLAGMGDEGSEDDDLGEDGKQFYRAAAKASTVKKAKRDEEGAAKRDAARRAAMDAYVEEDVDGERRASKDIIKNRGLTKYRNKERKYVSRCVSSFVVWFTLMVRFLQESAQEPANQVRESAQTTNGPSGQISCGRSRPLRWRSIGHSHHRVTFPQDCLKVLSFPCRAVTSMLNVHLIGGDDISVSSLFGITRDTGTSCP